MELLLLKGKVAYIDNKVAFTFQYGATTTNYKIPADSLKPRNLHSNMELLLLF